MITGVVGSTGGGKSLYAVELIHQFWLRGMRVATNIELTESHPAYNDVFFMEDDEVFSKDHVFFEHFPEGNAAYVIDEADVFWDAWSFRSFAESAKKIHVYAKQHRKLGDELVLITQESSFIVKAIRVLIHQWVDCSMEGPNEWPVWMRPIIGFIWDDAFRRYRRSVYSNSGGQPGNLLGTSRRTKAEVSEIWSWYKTEQLIGERFVT